MTLLNLAKLHANKFCRFSIPFTWHFPLANSFSLEKENIMGSMSEGKLLFKVALPMIFSVLVSSLYNLVDSIFVGRLGNAALTAISLGAPAIA